MDSSVVAAMARWPDVPHVYGWLRLDRRGQWRLRDEVIRHQGFVDFICRNYAADAQGQWFFQNGPQRVYVALDYTPWIVRASDGELLRQDGLRFAAPDTALIDDEGSLLLASANQAALVDDRELASLLDRLTDPDGRPLDDAQLERMAAGGQAVLHLGTQALRLETIRRREVAPRFGFQPDPQPRA